MWSSFARSSIADTHTWTDAAAGNNNWSDGGNWSPVGPPAFGDFVIVPTPAGGAGPAVVNVASAQIANMDVGANGTTPQVQVLGGKELAIYGGDLDNDGLIVINSDGASQITKLRFSAWAGDSLHTITGTGTVLMQAGPSSFPGPLQFATLETNSSVVTQEASHTIRGIGVIAASIINNGSIIADNLPAPPGENKLDLIGTGMTNNALLSAGPGGLPGLLASIAAWVIIGVAARGRRRWQN